MRVHRRMLGQQFDDGRDGEHVCHTPAFDSCPGFVDVEPIAREQHRLGGPRDLCELMDARTMRQRRNHQGRVRLRGARHQVAEVVGDDERHLPMSEDRSLGPPRRARGEEEPARVVMLDGSCRSGLA